MYLSQPEPEFRAMTAGPDERRHHRGRRMVLLDRRQRYRRRHDACHRDDQLLQRHPDVYVHLDPGGALSSPARGRPAGRHLDHVPEHDDLLGPVPQRHARDRHGIRHRRGWVHLPQGALLRGQRVERHADPGPARGDRPRSGRLGPDAVGGHRQARATWASPGWKRRAPSTSRCGWVPSTPRATSAPRSSPPATPSSGQRPDPATTVPWLLDPTNGTTFWAANEYAGLGETISGTPRSRRSAAAGRGNDWYSIDVAAGNSSDLQSHTPSDQGGQFPNTASLEIGLYDTFGNLVAIGTKLPDGRNESLFFNAPVSGQYHIEVYEDPNGSGEYLPVGRHRELPVRRDLGPGLQRPERQRQPRSGRPGPGQLGGRCLQLQQ